MARWYAAKEASKILRKKGKSLATIPADGKTSNGNERWSKERLEEVCK